MRKKFLAVIAALLFVALTTSTALAQTEAPEEALWYARYWNNTNMEGDPVLERNELDVDHYWGFGGPGAPVDTDTFSARWTSRVNFDAGTYRIATRSDDGVRVWVDDRWVIDNWTIHAEQRNVGYITLPETGEYNVVVEYFENTGVARVAVGWEDVSEEPTGGASLAIAPQSGPVGTTVQLTAEGFAPNALVDIGFGRVESEYDVLDSVRTDDDGTLTTLAQVPDYATADDQWVWVADYGSQTATSDVFDVTEGVAQPCTATVTVQEGDTLLDIAQICNTTVAAILAANPGLTSPGTIYPGTVLDIPAPSEVSATVGISPASGAAGRYVLTSIDGFPANTEIQIGVGLVESEYSVIFTTQTSAGGSVRTYTQIPDSANVGQDWVVVARTTDGSVSAVSNAFTVTAP